METDTENFIFEVVGSHPNFQRNVVKANPRNSRSLVEMIFLDTINAGDIAIVKEAARSIPVDNETVEWDCQDYVLEILDKLEEEAVLDEDDEQYSEAKEEVTERRGPVL